jgi:hypothetical protein
VTIPAAAEAYAPFVDETEIAGPKRLGAGLAREFAPAVRAIDAPAPQPIRWLIDDLWPLGELGLIVGDGGTFKSTVALHIAAAIAGGYAVFDHYTGMRAPVLCVSAEDPQDIVLMRLEAFCRGHGWDRRRVLENVHLLATDGHTLGDGRWRQLVVSELARIRPAFVVFDPWGEMLNCDESSNSEIRPTIRWLRSAIAGVGASICVVHHAGKGGQEKRPLDRIRGASALPSAARLVLFFDFKPDGVQVECLKHSRAPRFEPFLIARRVDVAADNRAMWTSARLTVKANPVGILTRDENYVLMQLRAQMPRRIPTRELRTISVGAGGVRIEDFTAIVDRLRAHGLIDYEDGKQRAKLWFVVVSSGSAAQAATSPGVTTRECVHGFVHSGHTINPDCVQCVQSVYTHSNAPLAPECVAPPKGGRNTHTPGSVANGAPHSAADFDPDDADVLIAERRDMPR